MPKVSKAAAIAAATIIFFEKEGKSFAPIN
jgi:hypothetical protein